MGDTHIDKDVVQVCLVRMEWALLPYHTHGHYAQGIKDGHTEYRQSEGFQVYIFGVVIECDGAVALQKADGKPGEEKPMTMVPASPMNILERRPKML